MSRMTTPTMDVVRFKEADVLCASGVVPFHEHRFATLFGWGNGKDNDASITWENGGVHVSSIDSLAGLLGNGGLNDMTFVKGSSEVKLSQLAGNENDYSGFNGKYEKDDESGLWKWSGQ